MVSGGVYCTVALLLKEQDIGLFRLCKAFWKAAEGWS